MPPRFRTSRSALHPEAGPSTTPVVSIGTASLSAGGVVDGEVIPDIGASSTAASASTSTSVTAGPVTPPTPSDAVGFRMPGIITSEKGYTSLRRSTRSTSQTTRVPALGAVSVKLEPGPADEFLNSIPSDEPGPSSHRLNSPSSSPSSPYTPRKRIKVKAEPITPIRTRTRTPIKSEARANGVTNVGECEDGEDDLKPIRPTPTRTPTPKKAMPLAKLAKPHPEPARWRQQYALIERMRKGIIAPVDDMGCERPQLPNASPLTARFHILISLMLSSQTKDAITSQAVTNLHLTLPGGLSAQSLAEAPADVVSGCINKVGFWRRKTDYIQDAARLILDKFEGDIPRDIEGLCEIKGVGPKMGFLALQCAWDINAGIGVDVHVHRITNRLKWHKPPTQTPEQTRINLESWLPSELHKGINPMLVGFGQVICLPVGPRCDVCLLSEARICPSRVANVKAEGRKEVVYTFTKLEAGAEPVSSIGVMGVSGLREEARAKVEIGYENEVEAASASALMNGTGERTSVEGRDGVVVVQEGIPLREVNVKMESETDAQEET